MKIQGVYEFTFYSGGQEIKQLKNLIKHTDYELFVKPRLDTINDIDCDKSISRNSKSRLIGNIKQEIKHMFGDYYFTDKSPLFINRNSGVIKLSFIKDKNVYKKYRIKKVC